MAHLTADPVTAGGSSGVSHVLSSSPADTMADHSKITHMTVIEPA